ncbi:MAG: hypothetical protein U1E78_01285 [Gammaproteobacteria bacterium]
MIFRVGAERSRRKSVHKVHDGENREGNNPENSAVKGIHKVVVQVRIIKTDLEYISGGSRAVTEVHTTGLDTNLNCDCTCECAPYEAHCNCVCYDLDTKSLSDEAEAGLLARWLWYYPSAFLTGMAQAALFIRR